MQYYAIVAALTGVYASNKEIYYCCVCYTVTVVVQSIVRIFQDERVHGYVPVA